MFDPLLLVCLAIGACAVAIGPLLGARYTETYGRVAIAATVLLPLASLVLFYSLAIHMHRSLGGWPRRIGDEGFPPGLVIHADFAQGAFGSLLLGGLFAWPIAVLLCVCAPRMRPGLRYLGLYAVAGLATFGAMQLAPAPYLNWWWD